VRTTWFIPQSRTHLAELYADQESIIAGILHDVVEDTPVTLRDVEENFGTEVALLVDGLTN